MESETPQQEQAQIDKAITDVRGFIDREKKIDAVSDTELFDIRHIINSVKSWHLGLPHAKKLLDEVDRLRAEVAALHYKFSLEPDPQTPHG